MKKIVIISLLSLVFILSSRVQADQVVLSNGDKISGEIIQISEGRIQVTTEYAGAIHIDFTKVADLKIERARRVFLTNGDAITGTIDSISDGTMIISSDALGDIRVPRQMLLSVREKEAGLAEVAPLETRQRLKQAEADLEEAQRESAEKEKEFEKLTSVSKLWSGSFSVGLQLERGNTDTSDLHVDVKATRKAPREELRLRAYADYGETEDKTDTNNIFGEAKLKVFQTQRRYLFGVTNMEYDELEKLDLRAQAFAGVGYNFIDKERTLLLGEVGAGITGEFVDENGNEETLEASLWLNAEWTQKIFDRSELYQQLTLYPSLGQFGDFRLHSETSVSTPLSDGWALKLSLIDDYDSDPEGEDVDNNDLKLISSVGYTF